MRQIDPRWVITAVAAGLSVGLSAGNFFYDLQKARPPDPIIVDMTVSHSNGQLPIKIDSVAEYRKGS